MPPSLSNFFDLGDSARLTLLLLASLASCFSVSSKRCTIVSRSAVRSTVYSISASYLSLRFRRSAKILSEVPSSRLSSSVPSLLLCSTSFTLSVSLLNRLLTSSFPSDVNGCPCNFWYVTSTFSFKFFFSSADANFQILVY